MNTHWIAVASIVSLLATPAIAQEGAPASSPGFADGLVRGESAANAVPTFGWGAGGFGGGCLLGCIGCLGVTGGAYIVDPAVPQHLMLDRSQSPDFQMGFTQGFEKRLKKRRATSAFVGGTLGAIVGAVLYVALTAQPAEENQQQQALPAFRF